MSLEHGGRLGRYEILEHLGSGGMGVVYRARDPQLERDVAIKVLPAELCGDPERLTRFRREARAAAAVSHPNICTIHEIGEADGQTYICMEYLEGQTLRQRIVARPLELDEVLAVAIQAADALAEAHAKGIIHRDIKSANILLSTKGQVKILDFGVAKRLVTIEPDAATLTGGEASFATGVGVALGTVAYMSPEQALGKDVDARSDLFSLGVVLYEVTTGMLPFRGDTAAAVYDGILHQAPEPPRRLSPNLPAELERIIVTLLEKDRELRYQAAAELKADLKRLLRDSTTGPAGAPADEAAPSVPDSGPRAARAEAAAEVRRRRALGMLAAGATVALLAVVALVLRGRLIPAPLPAVLQVAFLPFEVSGGDADARTYADGLMALLADKVGCLGGVAGDTVWVIPPSEMRRVGASDAATARRELGATLAVTGRLTMAPDTVRLELVLRDPASGRALRETAIADRASNLPALQDEPALRLASLVGLEVDARLQDVLRGGNTSVPSAFDACLRGLGLLAGEDDAARLEKAVAELERAVQADRLYARAWAGLAEACRRRRALDGGPAWGERAHDAAARAVALEPSLAAAWGALGDVEMALARPREAASAYAKAADVAPFAVEWYWKLARAHTALDENDAAVRAYETAIYRRPDLPGCYNQLGYHYYQQGRYEAAVTQFRHVVALLPEGTRGLNNLGAIYMFLDRWPEAIEIFERLLAVRPVSSAYSNLGTAYFYQSRFGDAARMFEKALELDSSDYQMLGNLAATRRLGGDEAGSRDAYRRAIAAAAADPRTAVEGQQQRADLAGYHAVLGESALARALLAPLIAENPDDPNVLEAIGEAFDDLGERQAALEWVGRALAAGYSRAVIENSPALRDLRADPGFARLTAATPPR